jgi:hypothetical protein
MMTGRSNPPWDNGASTASSASPTPTSRIEQVIAAARALGADASPGNGECVVLDESEDFYDYDRQELFSEEYAHYTQAFHECLKELVPHLGTPTYVGRPEASDVLQDAEGFKIAAWQQLVPPLYLSVWHADRELPIVVFLGRLPSAE